MKGLKLTCRTHGPCLGHSYNGQLLGYIEARKLIYVPSYKWMLENRCADLVKKIKVISQAKPVVLLDYDTNEDIENTIVSARLNVQLLQIIALFIVQFVLSSYICDEFQLYEIWKTYLRHPVS